jgi:uncharacterized protein YqhQ
MRSTEYTRRFGSIICLSFKWYDYESVALLGSNPRTMWIPYFYAKRKSTDVESTATKIGGNIGIIKIGFVRNCQTWITSGCRNVECIEYTSENEKYRKQFLFNKYVNVQSSKIADWMSVQLFPLVFLVCVFACVFVCVFFACLLASWFSRSLVLTFL